MLVFVVYVLVISNWHAYVNSNWNAQYMLFVIAEYLFKLGTRARTFLLVIVWHIFDLCSAFMPSARASKGILHTNIKALLLFVCKIPLAGARPSARDRVSCLMIRYAIIARLAECAREQNYLVYKFKSTHKTFSYAYPLL